MPVLAAITALEKAMSKKGKVPEVPTFLDCQAALALVVSETDSHSDRGLVLTCGSILGRFLERVIRMRFAELSPDDTTTEVHFLLSKKPAPPLRSDGLRVSLARVLGIIDSDIARSLSRFFDVRNQFAHEEVAPALDFLLVGAISDEWPKYIQARWHAGPEEKESPLMLLRFVTGVLLYSLHIAEMEIVARTLRKLKGLAELHLLRVEESQSLEIDEKLHVLEDHIAKAWS
jgi:hypothetical protein